MAEYVAGKYQVGKITNDIRSVEKALTETFLKYGAITEDTAQQEWIDKIETLSEGKNTVIFDDKDLPSIYYRMPARSQDQVCGNGINDFFESWFVDDAIISELYVAKYLAHNVTVEDAVYPVSLFGLDPTANINFDTAVAACARKGTGHALNTNANWMQLVLESAYLSGFQAHGNTNYGKYYYNGKETAEGSYRYDNRIIGRTKTGTGPNTWSHDGTPFGVFDMVGDVWEWCGGYRVAQGGEIQVLPNNDAMNSANSQAAASDKWKGIAAADGAYTAPATEGNLFYDCGGTALVLTDSTHLSGSTDSKSVDFKSLVASEITVPNRAIRLGIAPLNNTVQGRLYSNTGIEALSFRGGYFYAATNAGAFASALDCDRSYSGVYFGFRSAFYRN